MQFDAYLTYLDGRLHVKSGEKKKTFKESEIMSPPKIQLTYCSTTTLAPRYRPVLRKEQNPSLVAIQSDATFRRYAI